MAAQNHSTNLNAIRLEDRCYELDAARDKSMTHRAYIFAAMAKGLSKISQPLLSADCEATRKIFQTLGVASELVPSRSEVVLTSPGVEGWKRNELVEIDCGNSGTTARLLIGLLAAIEGINARLVGDASLEKRPMARVVDLMVKMGANISYESNEGKLPLAIKGKNLNSKSLTYDKASAQVKSAILLAAMNTEGPSSIRLPAGGRDHTENFLRFFGFDVDVSKSGADEVISVKGKITPDHFAITIPRDPSSAAFCWALPLFQKNGSCLVREVLDNPSRTGFLEMVARMGAIVERSATQNLQGAQVETVSDIKVSLPNSKKLVGITIQAKEVPGCIDEIPILAVIASRAEGVSRFEGLGELRVKESDRLDLTEKMLNDGGIKTVSGEDWLEIYGDSSKQPQMTGHFDPQLDHRLAMSAAIFGSLNQNKINSANCVSVSFPGFFQLLEGLYQDN